MKKIVFAMFVAIFTFSNVNAQKIELKKSFGKFILSEWRKVNKQTTYKYFKK
jgi:predicted RND superfamily exporter protein